MSKFNMFNNGGSRSSNSVYDIPTNLQNELATLQEKIDALELKTDSFPSVVTSASSAIHVRKSGYQNINTATDTEVTWDTEIVRTGTITHSTNDTKFYINTTGFYQLSTEIYWMPNVTGNRESYFFIDSVDSPKWPTASSEFHRYAYHTDSAASVWESAYNTSACIYITAGERVSLFVKQNSGSSLDLNTSLPVVMMEMTIVQVQ